MTQGVTYRPTEEQSRTVNAIAGLGVPHGGIAILLDIDAKTLRRHFRAELDRGSVEATAKVAQSLFQMATVDKSVAAAIFWMKARAGWREKNEVTVSDRSTTDLSDEELQRLIDGYADDILAARSPEPSIALIDAEPEVQLSDH